MIQFDLKNLLRNSLLFFFILIANCLFAQQDTIVVYEYIYKTDTVWLEPKHVRDTLVVEKLEMIDNATLFVDTITKNAELLIYSSGASATIPINRIIYNGKQHQLKMKRKGIITLLLLSFQMLGHGQAELNFYAGTTSHWFQHNASTISNPMWLGPHVGAEINFKLKNRKWGISSGVEFNYFFPGNDYKQTKAVDQSLSYLERDFAQIQTNVIINELNTGLFNSPFEQINVPVKLNYQLGNWRPYVGAAFNYSFFIFQIPEIYDGYPNPNYTKQNTHFFDIALLAGTRYSISKKLGLKIEMSQGLFGKNNVFEDIIKPTVGVVEYYFKSTCLSLSLVITL